MFDTNRDAAGLSNVHHLHAERSPAPDLRGQALEAYVDYLYALGLAEKTVKTYRNAVTRFWIHAADRGFDPVHVTATELSEYSDTLPNTASSKRQHRVALGHWYESIGSVTAPLKAVRVPPKKRYMSRALEPDEASRLARAAVEAGHPEGMAVLLGLYLGLRREEIARARWDRFAPEFDWYTVLGKFSLEATVPVHPVLKRVLLPNMSVYPWLFPGRWTSHVTPATINSWVQAVGQAAGIENLAPHRLRHTAIATVNDATGDLRMAQEFARHADITSTQIYTRVTKQRLLTALDHLDYLDYLERP